MRGEELTAFTERCIRGEPASCSTACPFHLDIRSFLDKAARGRWNPAYKQFRDAAVFPVIVAELCEAPCRERCQRATLGDEAIAVNEIERAVLRNVREQKPERYVIPPKEQRVAVVGAGVSGLACALILAHSRYRVSVFEKGDGWGGCLRGDARFPAFDEDIARQFSGLETDFRFGEEVVELGALLEDDASRQEPAQVAGDAPRFDAVYVASGAGGDTFGLLDTWDCAVYTTREPRVFLGGMAAGAPLVESIAQGAAAAKVIQGYLQTGAVKRTPEDYAKESCAHYLSHEGAERRPLVKAADAAGYTADEAREEAGRCLQCDCDACLAGCEMLRHYGKAPKKLTIDTFNDLGQSAFASRMLTRETYSCNLCGHCAAVCPEDVEVGGLLRASRVARMAAGAAPAAFHDFWLREMEFAVTEGAFASPAPGRGTCEYAFYPGCQLGAGNPEHVHRTYEVLAGRYDLGIMLGCCGAPAYWAGQDARFESHVAEMRQTWESLGRPTLMFACATCSLMFGSFLPEIPRMSVYEALAEATRPRGAGEAAGATGVGNEATPAGEAAGARGDRTRAGGESPGGTTASGNAAELPGNSAASGGDTAEPSPGTPETSGGPAAPASGGNPTAPAAAPFAEMAVFDPCAARDDTGMEDSVRQLARAAGVTLHELKEKNRCCGHGGFIRVANPSLYEEIAQHRADADDRPYLVYCANCREVFAWRSKKCAHVLDVALGLPVDLSVPTLDEKRANSLQAKAEMMRLLQGADFEPERHGWDEVTLVISPQLREQMEEKLISSAELKEAVWKAETGGDFFYDPADGSRVANLVKPVFTYWVQYRETEPHTYEVVAAYSHRMRVERKT